MALNGLEVTVDARTRARVAALTRWAREEDPRAATAKARDAFWQRFLDEADPAGVLPERERVVRAERLRKAHFARIAARAREAKRLRREQRVRARAR